MFLPSSNVNGKPSWLAAATIQLHHHHFLNRVASEVREQRKGVLGQTAELLVQIGSVLRQSMKGARLVQGAVTYAIPCTVSLPEPEDQPSSTAGSRRLASQRDSRKGGNRALTKVQSPVCRKKRRPPAEIYRPVTYPPQVVPTACRASTSRPRCFVQTVSAGPDATSNACGSLTHGEAFCTSPLKTL